MPPGRRRSSGVVGDGQKAPLRAGDRHIIVYAQDGGFCATDGLCTHEQGPLINASSTATSSSIRSTTRGSISAPARYCTLRPRGTGRSAREGLDAPPERDWTPMRRRNSTETCTSGFRRIDRYSRPSGCRRRPLSPENVAPVHGCDSVGSRAGDEAHRVLPELHVGHPVEPFGDPANPLDVPHLQRLPAV